MVPWRPSLLGWDCSIGYLSNIPSTFSPEDGPAYETPESSLPPSAMRLSSFSSPAFLEHQHQYFYLLQDTSRLDSSCNGKGYSSPVAERYSANVHRSDKVKEKQGNGTLNCRVQCVQQKCLDEKKTKL